MNLEALLEILFRQRVRLQRSLALNELRIQRTQAQLIKEKGRVMLPDGTIIILNPAIEDTGEYAETVREELRRAGELVE